MIFKSHYFCVSGCDDFFYIWRIDKTIYVWNDWLIQRLRDTVLIISKIILENRLQAVKWPKTHHNIKNISSGGGAGVCLLMIIHTL